MKKIFILTAAALTVFAACSKEKDVVSEEKVPAGMVKASFYADIDQTKSTESGATFSWTENEEVAVVAADDDTKLEFTCDNVSEGHFTGTIGEGKSFGFAISPYNAAGDMIELDGDVSYGIIFATEYNNYVPGTTNAIMVGTPGASGKFMFRHAAAAFKFTVENVPVGTAVVSVATNANITGTVSKNVLSGSGLEISNSDSGLNGKEVDLYLKDAVTAPNQTLTFYIPVPTGNYTSLTVTFFDGSLNELESKEKTGLNINLSRGDVYYTPKMTFDAVTINKGAEWAYTFEQKVFSANDTATLGGTTDQDWTLAGDGGFWGYDGTKGQQFGSGNAHYSSMTLTSNFGATYGISDVKINTSGASSIAATVSVSVGGVAFECEAAETVDLTTTATDYTFSSPDGNNYAGDVVISYEQTSSKAIYLKSITINPAAQLPQVATPTFSPAGGSYTETQNVTISCETTDATIYYTLDGTDPSNQSAAYTSAIEISATTTVKAIAVKDGMADSEIAEARYTIGSVPAGASYVKVTSELSDWSGQYLFVFEDNSVAFDGSLSNLDSTPNTFEVDIVNSSIASSSSIDSKSFTIASISGGYSIQASTGKYIGRSANSNGLDNSDSELVNTITWSSDHPLITGSGGRKLGFNNDNNQKKFRYLGSPSTIQLYKLDNSNVTPKVATPTISISGSDVSIACTTDGAAIYYTLDGSTPSTSSTAYLSSVSIAGSQQKTIKAFATKASYDDSEIAEETYYAINVNVTTNGTVTAIPYAAEGEEISLTVTPDSGYALDQLSVVDDSDNAVNVTNNKFTMPASPVTVSATFDLIPVTTISTILSDNTVTSNNTVNYSVSGVAVMAKQGNNYVIGDATGVMLMYYDAATLTLGNLYDVEGSVKLYNGVHQYNKPTVTAGTGTAPAYGVPESMTVSSLTSYASSPVTKYAVVRITAPASGYVGSDGTNSVNVYDGTGTWANYYGKVVNVTGYLIGFYNSKIYMIATAIEEDNTTPTISVSPSSLSWAADETDSKTLTVTLNGAAAAGDYGYSVTSGAATDWNISNNGSGTITVSPKAANSSTSDAKSITIKITHAEDTDVYQEVTCTQAKASDNNGETYVLTASQASGSAYQYSEKTVTEDDDSIWKLFGYGKNNSLWQLGGNKGSGSGAARCAYILTPACSSDITTVTINCKGSNNVAIYSTDASTLLTGMVKKPSSSSDLGDLVFSLPAGYTQVKIMFTSNSNGALSAGTNAACYINSVTVTTN